MMHAFALAAAVATNPTILRSVSAQAPRFVRLRLDVTAYGIAGRGEIVVDRSTGHFVRRFDAGPVSEREGWDGTHAWRADATGMARVQGNRDERAAIVDWGRLLCGCDAVPREHPALPAEIAVDPGTDAVTRIVRHIGHQTERTTFVEYRTAGAFTLPYALADTSENGAWTARVTAVDAPRGVAPDAFVPPPEPRDWALRAVETVALVRGDVPIVPVSVNGGAPLHFLLDTGGQNVITPDAARRMGMEPAGDATVGGAGAALAKIRFASARSVRVGTAAMRDQPFLVLDLGGNAPVDGIIGYEFLARFAVRLDLAHAKLEIAPDARALKPAGIAVPMVFVERQPQVDGAIDGLAGAMTIDTGSASSADVNTPFVVAHDLRARYHAEAGGYPISGIGGPVHAYYAHAKELRLGELTIPDVNLLLTDARAGAEADPTIAANIGQQVLRRFSVVFDYRNATIRFEAPAPERP